MVTNQGKALQFVAILLVSVCCSNFLSTISAYGVGIISLPYVSVTHDQITEAVELVPAWQWQCSTGIKVEVALVAGLVLGIFCSLYRWPSVLKAAKTANHWVTLFLNKLFIPLLPLFALGFILKMEHEGMLTSVVRTYAPIIVIVLLANILYTFIMFGIAAGFKPNTWLRYVKNALPAGMLAFSTMSSLATMPVTMNVAEKNTHDEHMSRAIIPATVNIHGVGNNITTPILAMAILIAFGVALPSFSNYLIFTYFFMLVQFAIPGVPCGSILVMTPLFEAYFGFTPEMSAFITAIFILFDPIVTAGNVFGNSALVIMLTKIFKWFSGAKKEPGVQ
jgi:Na+/H+-dicarboxylate symporter